MRRSASLAVSVTVDFERALPGLDWRAELGRSRVVWFRPALAADPRQSSASAMAPGTAGAQTVDGFNPLTCSSGALVRGALRGGWQRSSAPTAAAICLGASIRVGASRKRIPIGTVVLQQRYADVCSSYYLSLERFASWLGCRNYVDP